MKTLLFLLFGACLAVSPVSAQSTTGSISGVVTDDTKSVLPGATIAVTNVETGIVRTLVSDDRGRYRALNLVPGTYRVSAELSGFSSATREGLVVTIGSDLTADIALRVSTLAESVTVVGDTTFLDTTSTTVGGVVTTTQIAELPLNGRSFMQLATLQPGVVVSRATGREFTGGFGGTQIAVAGARPEHTGFLLEGTNIADIADKAPSSMAGVLLGVDTVQEFSVQTHGYSAEFGRAAGGVISAVTKSGTNVFKGNVFEFHRNSAMDAKNFFDEGSDPPPFRRNQFGATIGGPILRNKLFFFGSYEGLREKLSTTRLARLPNADAHRGFLPNATTGRLEFVGVQAQVAPYLSTFFPIPTGRDFGDGTAEHRHVEQDPTDENFYVGKIDWQVNAQDSFLVRYSSDMSDNSRVLEHPLFQEFTTADTRYLTVQHQRVFSSALLNQLRFSRNYTARDNDVFPTVEVPGNLYFTSDMHPVSGRQFFGSLNVTGISSAGVTASVPISYAQTLFQLSDTLTWNKGRSTWKAGFDWQRYHFDGYSFSRYGGEFRFRNLREFLTLSRIDRFTGNLPGTDTNRHMRQNYFAVFGQNDFRVNDTLSLNLGLRYEFVTTPYELDGKVAGLLRLEDLESGPRGVTPDAPFFDNPSKKSFGPRVGAVWKPLGDNTVIRSGFGIFYQPLTVSFYRGTTFRVYPYFAGVDIRQPTVFGPGVQNLLNAGTGLQVQRRSEFIFHDLEQPLSMHYHASLQHTLPGNMVLEVGYLGSRGDNLPFYGDPNSVPSEYTADGRKRVIPGATIRYPSWGRIRTRINIAESLYNGLILGLNKRFSQGLLFQGSYTFGKSTDDWSGGQIGSADFETGAGSATDWWDPKAEHGRSSFDVRHNFVFNAVYALPWGEGLTGMKGVLATGWQIGGIVNLASGIPFTVFAGFDRAGDLQSDAELQKPDRVEGIDTILGDPAQWFNPLAFSLPERGYFGNARRNTLDGPGLATVDMSIFKNTRVGTSNVQFRVEVFNLLNRANFATPSSVLLFNPDGSRRQGVGQITRTTTTARQVQLGLKFVF